MQAVVVGANGVELADRPVPQPSGYQVLVKVAAAALNRADLHVAAGHKHGSSGGVGATVGIEWAGTVESLGSAAAAAGLAVGDRVMCSGTGAFAEYALADRGRVYRLPPGLDDFGVAASLPVALQTAHEALTASGELTRGQSVLVQGATSGVGLMTLQVARALGAGLVMGTSTTPERRGQLGRFGADLAIDTTLAGWPQQVLDATGGAGSDLLIDFVAGDQMNANMRATRICGRIVNVGRMGGFSGPFDFDLHSLRRIRYIGATFRTRSPDEVRTIAQRMQADLWEAVSRGLLRLPISRRFKLAEAADALDFMRANAHFGKVILEL